MKRYTGQKALYEAISRSRAKTKRGSILERLLPESVKQEKGPSTPNSALGKGSQVREDAPGDPNPKPPVPAGLPPADPTRGGAAGLEDASAEPSRPVWERLYEEVAGPEDAEPQRVEKVEETEMPAQESAVSSVVEPRALEEADLPAPARNVGSGPQVHESALGRGPSAHNSAWGAASPSPNAMNRVGGALPMWWRLKPLQLNEGRIEISVSYHVGLAVALAVILVILAGFRLGQRHSPVSARPEPADAVAGPTEAPVRAAPENATTATSDGRTPPTGASGAASPAAGTAQPSGDNWIVLATHGNKADLEAVKDHFARSGIGLAIYELQWLRQYLSQNGFTVAGLPSGDGFMLVTSDLFHNPQNPETDGYKMRQRIAAVGATYRAEKGREPFTPHLFGDAYGMKISRVK